MAHETNYKDDLEYVPAPAVDPSFEQKLAEFVPMSPNGKDRMLRFVWGCDRLEFYAGEWDRRYGDTDHDPAKYVGRARWVLEMWGPPEAFNQAEWELKEDILGPWPYSGTWDFVAFHTDLATEAYLPLDHTAINHARLYADRLHNPTFKSVEMLLEQKQGLWAKRKKERRERADEIAREFGEDVVKCFENSKDVVSTSGKNIGRYKQTDSGIFVPNN